MESILSKLNEQQKIAGEKIEGPLLILAGAGSGKTRTITYRIAHMIMELGISPYSILAVTFTNKAAKEMKERVESLVGENGKRVMISTFHSFGLKLLRIYSNVIGYDANFTIYDVDDQKKIVKAILKKLVVKDSELTEGKIVSRISKLKEDGVDPEDYEKNHKFEPNANIISEVYKRYNTELKINNSMDFSDILVNTYKLLEGEEILKKVQEKYKYIMVDEYQDTNNIQYNIVNKIAGKYKNICVVGDENQSIYGFRGANIRNILDFEKDYPNATIIKLEENYRSTKTILQAANSVIKNNKTSKNKKLWTSKASGEKIFVKPCITAREEVNYVIEKIVEMKSQGKRYNDFTILYRTNAQSRLFEEGFLRYGIPYKIFGGMQFYQRMEVKDILAYLSVINNQKDGINLNRIINIPKRKIGSKTLEKINLYGEENNLTFYETLGEIDNVLGIGKSTLIKLKEFYSIMEELISFSFELPVSEIFDLLISKISYKEYLKTLNDNVESRIENIDELKNSIVELEKILENLTLREYLENVSLISATDDLEEEKEYIKLMTIHNAKGLEFPVVFLVGMEDELFPNAGKVLVDEDALEEERRVCYVAITRAEEKLFMSYSVSRYVYGREEYRTASRFIEEISPELIKKEKNPQLEYRKKQAEKDIAEKILERHSKRKINTRNTIDNIEELKANIEIMKNLPYRVGEKVSHSKFGLGKIIGVNEKKVTVQFVTGKKNIAMVLAGKFLTKE
ncbi:MAG: UvrD-helicase domain-containing protein [Fusobacterium sp. JB021]|nr:UvrD-helicase domain-containing protein [Fusobacterium sp. JB020]MDP0493604.1 UvrD-helicase domain-containing protein [Fusobacterium sp. JB021]MDP0507063.1 UvrD-helicase domain-containing protein [Fusobacterium sp. JB019]